uniref:Solute carrier organic anion transporter family member 2A1 n=1 Tax=Hucho hucho TaxID=62062 RepID=A0A4W5JQN4_9TELE
MLFFLLFCFTLGASQMLFVLCHGLLQLTQLLYSSYFKSTITTIERRFGLSSFSSGTISSLHEVGNTILIVFVSYLGSRVHRPRLIGLGGLLMSVSALILALPHFLSQPYAYDSVINDRQDLCSLQSTSNTTEACGKAEIKRIADTNNLWLLMAIAQLLFGVGSVPIQPFGISYVDDFAGRGNSPLYIAILFALSVFGPAFGFLLGSVMLRIYVDVDRASSGRYWVYMVDRAGSGRYWVYMVDRTDSKKPEFSMLDFLKMFPRLFVRLLLSPLFLLLVLSQCCFSSVIAGLATFLNKFLERQYSTSTAYSNLLIGAVNLPSVAVGMLLGGVIMKRTGLSLKTIPRFSVAMLTISVLLIIPLFFMGCPTQRVATVNYKPHGFLATCYSNCSCPANAFNPVCGSDNIEYLSPCHAGCKNYTKDSIHNFRVLVGGSAGGIAHPGPCPNQCPHYLLPVMFLISLAGMIASLTHNPIYMMVISLSNTQPHLYDGPQVTSHSNTQPHLYDGPQVISLSVTHNPIYMMVLR